MEPHTDFMNSSSIQCRVFCCPLWAIWKDKNKGLHEAKKSTGPEVATWINRDILRNWRGVRFGILPRGTSLCVGAHQLVPLPPSSGYGKTDRVHISYHRMRLSINKKK
ncbi:hypothetical protein ERO13_A13G164150v2 [Gossypium hirsutum]|nr:hypothetical protein ERO13_A13G164150v2 [Gossypium hirsutum]